MNIRGTTVAATKEEGLRRTRKKRHLTLMRWVTDDVVQVFILCDMHLFKLAFSGQF
jgi:hypothetical protein